jgi:hypothetical protein
MMNMSCSNALLVSVLNPEDLGTLNIFNETALLSNGLVEVAFQGPLTD